MSGRSSKSLKWHLGHGFRAAAARGKEQRAADLEWAKQFKAKIAAKIAERKKAR